MISGHACSENLDLLLLSRNRTYEGWFNTSKKGIYLREEGEYVGPFLTLADAEVFLELMKLFGGSCEGIEIVIEDADKLRDLGGVSVEEKWQLGTARDEAEEPVPQLEHSTETDTKASEPNGVKGNRRAKPDRKVQ